MLASPCTIISDAHLGVASRERERELIALLRHVATTGGSLVVNGDLFDFWFEWKTVIPRAHFRTLAALADLRDAGVPVLMIGGNHDCWGGEVLTRDIGIDYRLGAWEGDLAGWRAFVAHGDGMRGDTDRNYRRFRHVLRHPWSIAAFRMLHPDVGSRLAHGTSGASRARRAHDEGEGLRQVAHGRLESQPRTDLVVLAHSHVPTVERARSGGVYANAGSWAEDPTFLVITPAAAELRRWNGSTEGELIDAVDRRTEEALADA